MDGKKLFHHGMRIALAILLAGAMNAAAPTALAQTAQTTAEIFVLSQLNATGAADLSDRKDPVIRHDFLEDLLSSAHRDDAIAKNGITITGAYIAGQLNKSNVTVPFSVNFTHCTFSDGLDLSGVKFARDFSLVDHTVVGLSTDNPLAPNTSAVFAGMKVVGNTNLSGTTFYSDVDFTKAEFGGAFKALGVQFHSRHQADFDSIKAKAPVSFANAQFGGELYLSNAELASLDIENDHLPSEDAPGLSLEINQAHLDDNLWIKNIRLASLEAGSAAVRGTADFENVVPGDIDFRLSQIGNLSVAGSDLWLRGCPKEFLLYGLSFDSISIDKPGSIGRPVAAKMLRQLERRDCPFRQQPYLDLEKFLSSNGSPADADMVYIALRERQRSRLSGFLRFLDWTQDLLVGYGRRTWKAALYALTLILIGAIIFQRGRMDPDNGETERGWYNPFWYSLDLLSPVDLGVAPKWRAKNPWLRNYAQVHRVAGWILIPLIAAAITGIIK